MILQPNVLSEGQMERIRKATEEILEVTGFRVAHTEAREKARRVGAQVDDAGERVRIPAPLLRELLSQVPSSFSIAGSGGQTAVLGGGDRFCLAIVTDPWIVDYESQLPRRPCIADLRRHSILGQRLDRVVGMSRMDFPVTDVEGVASSLRSLEEYVLHQNKHLFVYVTSLESFHQYLDIGRLLLRGKELKGSRLMSVAVAALSPLTITSLNVQLMQGACEFDFPVVITTCPMAGTTSPYSLASTLLVGNVENIFLAALTQIMKPGNPFLYAFGHSVTDMRSGYDLYYTPEKALWKMAAAQLTRSYHMPSMVECGGSLTYRYDQQNGAEGMLFMLSACASESDLLSGIGSCHNACGMSAEMMIIQTAWLEAVEFLCRGIDTDDLHLGLHNIMEAGPGGNFLGDDLTLKFLRGKEFFSNDIFDLSGGHGDEQSLLERAHARVEDMVAGFDSPHPGQVQEDLRRYFNDQRRRIES